MIATLICVYLVVGATLLALMVLIVALASILAPYSPQIADELASLAETVKDAAHWDYLRFVGFIVFTWPWVLYSLCKKDQS